MAVFLPWRFKASSKKMKAVDMYLKLVHTSPADNFDKRVYPLFLQSLADSKIYAASIVYL
jgi:hypothetical protein